jgi:RNA polymerase primary sigma factor
VGVLRALPHSNRKLIQIFIHPQNKTAMSMRNLKISKSITNRETESLEKYLQEIGKLQLLNPEEEADLTLKIKEGDQKALERLIKANLRFVVSVAKQYQNQGLSLPDLINEGNLGLISAARRFDETKGFKFISYAVWWIRQSIHQAISEQSRLVRLPINKVELGAKINRAYQHLEQEFEREPTTEELAEFLGISSEEVSASVTMSARHVSVDSPVGDDEESGSLMDILPNNNAREADENLVYDESLKMDIDLSMQTLNDKQKQVIKYYYGIGTDHPLTLEDIGERFSLTRERVRQIRDKAIAKLRTTSRSKELRMYL